MVLHHECVVALTPAAARAGALPGMRRGGVSALAPHAIMLERDGAAEQAAFEGAALALLQYTPEITAAAEDTILMNIGASLRAFGGPRRLIRRVAATVQALGLQASLGMGPTAAGAWLLARAGRRRRVLRVNHLQRQLDPLACVMLPQARSHHAWLQGIGCHTLGQLRQLPRGGLQRRCGSALIDALDRAYGRAPQAHAWIQAPQQFKRRYDLIERLEHTEGVLAVARKLVEQMSGWLTARQRAVPRLTLIMEHERGRHARPPTLLELSLAEPAWQADHLVNLLRERLSRLTLAAPVVAVILDAAQTVAQPAVSATLFPEPGNAGVQRARLLDLLTARLGRERVRQPAPVADHRPETANHWCAALDKPPAPPGVPVLDRPLWLVDPPVPLQMQDHRPVYGTPLTLVRGPERIESGWWNDPIVVRDYFVAEAADAARYWVYRERGHQDARWFLQGLYA